MQSLTSLTGEFTDVEIIETNWQFFSENSIYYYFKRERETKYVFGHISFAFFIQLKKLGNNFCLSTITYDQTKLNFAD